jgi:ATP-dependent DNA helicase RecG
VAVLSTPLADAVGGRTAKPFETHLDVRTVGDLLRHYPRRLAQRGELTPIAALQVDDDVTVVAQVRSAEVKRNRNSSGLRLEAIVTDGTHDLRLTFFGRGNVWRDKDLVPGRVGIFAGKVSFFNKHMQLTHPDYQLLSGEEAVTDDASSFANAMIPIYPATQALRTWHIANTVRTVLMMLDPVADPLPAQLRQRHALLDLDTALRRIHQPGSWAEWGQAKARLKWDEALGIQLVLAKRRAAAAADPATIRTPRPDGILAAFDAELPFELTAGQQEVAVELARDLERPHPMMRLLQGEVGSGKTVVAVRAMLQVVDAGGQAALLAPTEVLAAQHARSISALLGAHARAGQFGAADQATRVALLTGSLPTAARKAALLEAASGGAGIVIGTHALIQDTVEFADLGLVVVDEQHRFGVEQRDALRGKAKRPPHLLVMTATPIPRTVAMTVFGDLDTSTLRQLPAGRAPISTTVVPAAEKPQWLDRAWQRIREEVAAGRQAYVVCPRIGDDGGTTGDDGDAGLPDAEAGSDDGRRPALAVLDVIGQLADGPLAGLRIAALHGRMATDDKDRVMSGFGAGELDVLVATTVVEVGVDVPNATVMVILDADRFGMSQLHQLRGRVGRGAGAGICLLVTEMPPGTPARERLDAVASTTDGFELARLDVEQRREGDVLGAAQSGRRTQLKLLSVIRDEDVIVAARSEARDLVAADPDLHDHPLLADIAALLTDERAEYLEKS